MKGFPSPEANRLGIRECRITNQQHPSGRSNDRDTGTFWTNAWVVSSLLYWWLVPGGWWLYKGGVVFLDQNEARACYDEGNLLLRQGANNEAEEAFKKALAIDPDYADAHSKLGVVFAERGDRPAARAQFERALQLNERHCSALTNLGNLHFLEGDLGEAERCHRLAIEYDPDNPVPHNNLAAVLKKQKKVQECVDEIKAAQRLTRRQQDDQVRTELKAGPKRGCLGSTALIALITIVVAMVVA